jgi:monofunctional biosynthetic peptidoglycan transglycosylase
MGSKPGRIPVFRALKHLLLGSMLAVSLVLAGLLVAYSFLPPVSITMLVRWMLAETVDRNYVRLEDISMDLREAVIVSEDARFCRHGGVDWGALRSVIDGADADGPSRGASTITMQTVKNLFLWPSRSYLRKALEIPLALLIDAVWPKRRILEVYLNIAEWGEGLFGVEAAARRYFATRAARIDAREAALLATALPSPQRRDPARPSRGHAALARKIFARMQAAGPADSACVR